MFFHRTLRVLGVPALELTYPECCLPPKTDHSMEQFLWPSNHSGNFILLDSAVLTGQTTLTQPAFH